MRSIYKYDITTAENGIIEGPIVKLLTAQVQHNTIVVWAEVDTSKPNRKFQILPIGTGWPLDAPAGKDCILDTHSYISTIQIAGGSLVFHIYAAEILPKPVKKDVNPNEKLEKAKVAINNNNMDKKEASFTVTNVRINPDVLAHFLQ
jgi:hypothetical protein